MSIPEISRRFIGIYDNWRSIQAHLRNLPPDTINDLVDFLELPYEVQEPMRQVLDTQSRILELYSGDLPPPVIVK